VTAVAFTVFGVAAPAGSKRGFVNRRTGRVILTDDSKRSRPWKADVTAAAIDAMSNDDGRIDPPMDGPLLLEVTFWVARPKGHYGTGRNADRVKPAAPAHPAVKPDLLKLARAVEDALTAIVYKDDAQIVAETLQKAYTSGQPRTEVRVVPVIDRGERA
jgi:Holliday junction resolvase RusA-like endonuclease